MNRYYYAGIGSRSTPSTICTTMCEIARALTSMQYILRSGGASGADRAFENGAGEFSQIFVPWPGFNGRFAKLESNVIYDHVSDMAIEMAAKFHPAWHKCSDGARKLHARNCYQILGPGLNTPVKFILCWTPNGLGGGGTGQAIRIARHHGIPVYDMGSKTGLGDFLRHAH